MNIITNSAKKHDGQGDIDASITDQAEAARILAEQQEEERLLSKQAEKEQFKRDLAAATAHKSLVEDARKRASVKNWITQAPAMADNPMVSNALRRAER